MRLIEVKLFLADLAALKHGTVGPDLFQSQQVRTSVHDASRQDDTGDIDPARRHQMRRHAFVAARNINRSVEGGGAGMNFYHICHHVPGGQGVVHSVMPLCLSVADVRAEISGPVSTFPGGSLFGFFCQLKQMDAARVAVPKGAFDENLRFCQILHFPSCSQPERIQLRRLFP